VFVGLEMALLCFIVGLLPVDKIIGKLFKLNFVKTELGKKYFLRSINRNNSMKVRIYFE
jgi:hypothetical protein